MENIIHFNSIRKEKENQLSNFVVQHAKSIQSYVDRQVNIREKVKAKHIFSEKVGCEQLPVLSKIEEQLFLDWFTFDYVTIRGKTNYQTFVEQSCCIKHSLDAVVHALFMASALEPFKVIKTVDNHIYAEKILTGENFIVKTSTKNELLPNEYIFLRSIPVFDHLLCINGIFIQNNKEKIVYLQTEYKKSTDSWRTFLKKFSIKYSWTRN